MSGPGHGIFPWKDRNEGGWVVLNMMISPKGKAYEVSVLDSSGTPDFEEAAVKSMDRVRFQPARSAGTPVDSSLTLKMVFYQSGARGVTPSFQSAYHQVIQGIVAGERAQVDAQLAKLKVENPYEDAVRSFVQSLYDEKWGTEAQQLVDLGRAVAGDNEGEYLPKPLFVRALMSKLFLEVKSAHYGNALNTWKDLKADAPADMRKTLQQTIDEIAAIRASDKAVRTSESIDNHLSWNGRLFKNTFALSVSHGTVSEIKLRCKKKYLFFKYEAGIQYTISPNAGDCSIEVVGDAGTTFDLLQ